MEKCSYFKKVSQCLMLIVSIEIIIKVVAHLLPVINLRFMHGIYPWDILTFYAMAIFFGVYYLVRSKEKTVFFLFMCIACIVSIVLSVLFMEPEIRASLLYDIRPYGPKLLGDWLYDNIHPWPFGLDLLLFCPSSVVLSLIYGIEKKDFLPMVVSVTNTLIVLFMGEWLL